MLKSRFSLGLKSNDDKTNKDVHHEKRNNDDVNEVKYGNIWTVVVFRTDILCIGVYGDIQNSETVKISILNSYPNFVHSPRPALESCDNKKG